jgi:hypothetical protein
MQFRRSILAVGLILSAGLAACADAAEPQPILIEVPTQLPGPPGPTACMTALLSGSLVADARLGIAIAGSDGTLVKVRWPSGYVGRQTGSVVELLDGEGRVVARVGDHVETGGGLGVGDWWYACGQVVAG